MIYIYWTTKYSIICKHLYKNKKNKVRFGYFQWKWWGGFKKKLRWLEMPPFFLCQKRLMSQWSICLYVCFMLFFAVQRKQNNDLIQLKSRKGWNRSHSPFKNSLELPAWRSQEDCWIMLNWFWRAWRAVQILFIQYNYALLLPWQGQPVHEANWDNHFRQQVVQGTYLHPPTSFNLLDWKRNKETKQKN